MDSQKDATENLGSSVGYPQGCCGMPCHRCIVKFDLRHPAIPQLGLDSARMILCETCGFKRCPHASDHRLKCTVSNEPEQQGSVYSLSRPDWED
jgi:hypothetical protein